MNQTTSNFSKLPAAVRGAFFMILAGIAFAGVNIATQWATQVDGQGATAVAFYQYLFALVFALPWIWREGRKALATNHLGWHIVRVVLSAGGVQAFVSSLASLEIWLVIALTMTSPFFVIAGAGLLLKENITMSRIVATVTAFIGAMIILEPWSATFTLTALLPILAAALWAGASLITKFLTADEKPATITVYLLLLLTPINAVVLVTTGFVVPAGSHLMILLALGVLTAAANYCMTRAYATADAAYLQPFDDLKLPLNVLASWLVFAYAPSFNFWPGAALIAAASLYIATRENKTA